MEKLVMALSREKSADFQTIGKKNRNFLFIGKNF